MTTAGKSLQTEAFVRSEMVPQRAAPISERGVIGWVHEHLFPNWWNAILTLVGLYLIISVVWNVVDWGLLRAVWTGTDREACLDGNAGFQVGACWALVRAKFAQWIYGFYPPSQRYRVDIAYFVGLAALIPMMIPKVPFKWANAVFLLGIYPVMTLILLTGGNFGIGAGSWIGLAVVVAAGFGAVYYFGRVAGIIDFGMASKALAVAALATAAFFLVLSIDFGFTHVETSLWGGLLVTLVVAVTGIVASLPLGILLALGRRSNMPVVRLFSIIFIEFWRGVPLITVLFMASVMLPLFLPQGVNFDKLLRALIGVALFSSAYMAEVVRGGLQAIPKGQYEAAQALGMSYWKMMGLIVLPQALRIVIPGIVNSFIALFKDTTLVSIIGLFDLLGIVQAGFADASWSTPQTSATAYFFAAMVFWMFCFSMSRYSIFMERKLSAGQKR